MITILKSAFDCLFVEIAALKGKIRFLKNERDSGVSSTPPAQDLVRSLREPSGKPVGEQEGH